MAVEYKYKPKTQKAATNVSSLPSLPSLFEKDEIDKSTKALQSQYDNLKMRLEESGVDPEGGGEVDNRNLIEKALNLDANQGLIMDFFEVIDRPTQAIKGALAGAFDKDEDTKFLEGLWKGLSGQEEMTGTEFLDSIGSGLDTENMGKFQTFMTDVLVDVVLDPLTYVPGGFFAKKLLGKHGKLITQTAAQRHTTKFLKSLGIEDLSKVDDVLQLDTLAQNGIFKNADHLKQFSLKNVGDGVPFNWDEAFESGVIQIKGSTKAAGEATEDTLVQTLGKKVKETEGLEDILVYQTKTANQAGDITLLKKMDDGSIVKFQSIEVKDLYGGAYGSNSMVFSIGEDGTIQFGKGKNFKKLSPEKQEKLLKAMNKLTGLANDQDRPLAEIVGMLKNRTLKKGDEIGQTTLQFGDDILDQVVGELGDDAETFGKLLFDIVGDIDDEWVGFVDKNGAAQFLRGEDLLKNIDISGKINLDTSAGIPSKLKKSVNQTAKSLKDKGDPRTLKEIKDTLYKAKGYGLSERYAAGQTRLMTNIKAKDTLVAQTDEFWEEVLAGGMVSQKKGLGLRIIESARAKSDVIDTIAKSMGDVADSIKRSFNMKHGIESKTVKKLQRLGGEAAYKAESYGKRLTVISKNIAKGNSKGLQYTTQILEAGFDATGAINTAARKVDYNTLYRNAVEHAKAGKVAILPNFTDDIMADNFIKNFNDTIKQYNNLNGDVFKLLKKDGSYALQVLDDVGYDGLTKLDISEEIFGRKLANFGKVDLDPEALKFFDEFGDEIMEMQKVKDELTSLLIDELGFDALPDAMKGTNGYMRHIVSKEGRELMKASRPAVRSPYVKEGVDMLATRSYIGSIDEVNKGMKAFYGMGDDFFDSNAHHSMADLIRVAVEREEQAKVLTTLLDASTDAGKPIFQILDDTVETVDKMGAQFKLMGNFKDEFNKMYKNLSPDAVKAFDAYLIKNGFGKGKVIGMHKSAYQMLRNIDRAFVEVPDIIKNYDKFLNNWKSLTLMTGGFHMRNFFGNMSNSYLVGMGAIDQVRYGGRASTELLTHRRVMAQIAEGTLDPKDLANQLTKADFDSYMRVKDYFESGASQIHKGYRDLDMVKKQVDDLADAGGAKGAYNKLVSANYKISETMDDVQRYALYSWSTDKATAKLAKQGVTGDALIQQARGMGIDDVHNALFDYSNLTSFEKDYMKRLFPFYTFMKNNLIFQAKNIVANPKYYARTGRAYKYYTEDMMGVNMEDMPSYMSDNMWLPIPAIIKKGDGESIRFLKANLPVSDFTELVENPFKKGATSITAPIKIPLELGANTDFFTGGAIKKFPGEKSRLESTDSVLSGVRDAKGNFSLTGDPTLQKIGDDLGLRTPRNLVTGLLDLADTVKTGITGVDATAPSGLMNSMVADKNLTDIQIAKLYSDIEHLRNLKSLYEQETGEKLPTLAELGIK